MSPAKRYGSMKRLIPYILLAITGLNVCILSAQAASGNEKYMYLGVLNGQVKDNSVVKVRRTLPEPVLFRADKNDGLPERIVIRNAEGRTSSGGSHWVTLRETTIQKNAAAKVTIKMSLIVDGKKMPIVSSQRGQDLVIEVTGASDTIEIRTDEPVELEVPANYRGNIKMEVQIEGDNIT